MSSEQNSVVEENKQIKRDVQEKSIQWGADLVGFANSERFDRYSVEHRPPKEARTVIVLAIWMADPILDLWLHPPSWKAQGKADRAFEDEILRGVSLRLSLMLERAGHWAQPARYEPGLYLKEAGVLAGLGLIGKNNLLITREYGPRVRLRALYTSILLEPDPIAANPLYCHECNKCVEACPANALTNGKYSRTKCLRYCEDNLRQISEHSVLWCMKCSDVCPVGKPSRS